MIDIIHVQVIGRSGGHVGGARIVGHLYRRFLVSILDETRRREIFLQARWGDNNDRHPSMLSSGFCVISNFCLLMYVCFAGGCGGDDDTEKITVSVVLNEWAISSMFT
jgi:hypothetical protein